MIRTSLYFEVSSRVPAGADALLPAFREDVEVGAGVIGVGAGDLDIEVDAETRPVGEREMAVRRIDGRMPGDEVARPVVVEGVEMLLDEEIGDAGSELQADRLATGPPLWWGAM